MPGMTVSRQSEYMDKHPPLAPPPPKADRHSKGKE